MTNNNTHENSRTGNEKIGDAVLVPQPSKEFLKHRQLLSYREHRRKLLTWMLEQGKDPEKADGYSEATVNTRAKRLDKFYRWVWMNQTDGYTERITHDHADAWMKHLARQDLSESYKNCCQKAVKTLFKWKNWKENRVPRNDWNPVITYSDDSGSHNPRDFLTKEERKQLREAAVEYKSIPHYNQLSTEERDSWKAYLAQRFGKKKEDVSQDDWKKTYSFKVPSLVWVSMDAGLRPIEVGRARVGWLDLKNNLLRIPKEQSSKNRGDWSVAIGERTSFYLEKWLDERRAREKYESSDRVWLTREGNPYSSQSLNSLLDNLCEEAGIDNDERGMTWYSIRHSVGTYMAREEGLAAAQQQLRHKSQETTMKYDQAAVEDRKDALDRMG